MAHVTTIQLYLCMARAARHTMRMNGHSCVPIKIYLRALRYNCHKSQNIIFLIKKILKPFSFCNLYKNGGWLQIIYLIRELYLET